MNKYFNDEIAAILKESKEDPIVILANRLKNYIKIANSTWNYFLTSTIDSTNYNQTNTCTKLIPKLSVIFNQNKTNVDAKIEEEWSVVDSATIKPKGHFAAILGAFIAIFPEYAQQIPDNIRAQLPIATNWFQHLGIEKQREELANNINHYPNQVLPLFPVLPKTTQHEIVDTNIMKGLRHPDDLRAFPESCKTIKTIFQYIDDDKSTQVIRELLHVIEKYRNIKAIETLGEIYPYIKSKECQSEVINWVSKPITNNMFTYQSTFRTAATIYPHVTEEKQQTLVFNIIRDKLKINATEAVYAIKAISPHLTQGYAGLSSDFTQLVKNFSHVLYSIRAASAVACGALYKHMEAKDEALLNTFFDQLLSVMSEKKEEQLIAQDTYLESACISLATAYPHFKTSSASQQKEKFFTALSSLSPKFLSTQHQAFALIYPHLEDDKAPRLENDSKSLKSPRSFIVDKLTTYFRDINQTETVVINRNVCMTAASIFLTLNPQKDSEYYNGIFNAVFAVLKKNHTRHTFTAVCDTLRTMKSNFTQEQTHVLTNHMLTHCKENWSSEPEFGLLGAMLPLHQDNNARQMILNFLITKALTLNYFPEIIANYSKPELMVAARLLVHRITSTHYESEDDYLQFFINIERILKNIEERQIEEEIHASLPSLSSSLTRLICSYRK